MKGYTDKLYCRPANQYESDYLMTNKVNHTNLMLLVFLDLKNRDSFINNIWSHETTDPYLKSLHFNAYSSS